MLLIQQDDFENTYFKNFIATEFPLETFYYKMRRSLFIILIFIHFGCEKDTTGYLELVISDSYLNSDYLGIALLSDNEGTVLDHQRFINNDQIKLSGSNLNSTHHLTLIKLGNKKNQSHHLTTYKNVPSGHFYIYPSVSEEQETKQITINNQNSIYSLASTSAGLQDLWDDFNIIEAGIHDEFIILSTDIYSICDFRPCITMYSYLPIINDEILITEGLQPLLLDTIYLNDNLTFSSTSINGIKGKSSDLCKNELYYIPAKQNSNNGFILDWNEYFDGFEIEYKYELNQISHKVSQLTESLSQQPLHVLPEYDILNKQPGQFSFNSDNPYTYYSVSFQYKDPDLKNIYWNIIDGNQDNFKLPNLDNIRNLTYINDKKDDLEFEKLDVYIHSSLNAYDDFLLQTYYSSTCNYISMKYNHLGDYIIQSTMR